MPSEEELYKEKILQNKFIEEGTGWSENDSYYCENRDNEIIDFLKKNMDSEFSIKNLVFTFYQVLKNRYHNNFYIEFIQSQEEILFVYRGQPIFNSKAINIIIKYILTINKNDCFLTINCILPNESNFELEKNCINNYENTTTNNKTIENNSSHIKILLDSISLKNYIKLINHDNSSKTDTKVVKDTDNQTIDTDENKNLKETEPIIYCPNCGEANYSLYRKCQKCKSTLVSYMIPYQNKITSYDEILSEMSIKQIKTTKIPLDFYELVLETISKKCENINLNEDMSVYNKIVHITKNFVNITFDYDYYDEFYKFGNYKFDTININPNFSHSQQCSSMIKYLSVEIHLEIMEALFMYIFNVQNNAFVRNFINMCRSDLLTLCSEFYYSIKVESNFIPKIYQNYDEIDYVYNSIKQKKITYDDFKEALNIGEGYALDIIKILDRIFTQEIKIELANEFKYDKEVAIKGIPTYNNETKLTNNQIIECMKNNMINTLEKLINDENLRNTMYRNHELFKGKGNSI